jgi:hypothetical protein
VWYSVPNTSVLLILHFPSIFNPVLLCPALHAGRLTWASLPSGFGWV